MFLFFVCVFSAIQKGERKKKEQISDRLTEASQKVATNKFIQVCKVQSFYVHKVQSIQCISIRQILYICEEGNGEGGLGDRVAGHSHAKHFMSIYVLSVLTILTSSYSQTEFKRKGRFRLLFVMVDSHPATSWLFLFFTTGRCFKYHG